jgi:hypothetical protein
MPQFLSQWNETITGSRSGRRFVPPALVLLLDIGK